MLNTLLTLALNLAPAPAPMFVDYVLQVPIRIENMRNVTSATLNCDISHIGTTATDRYNLTTPGSGSVSVPLVNGAYTGTLTVTVNVSAANAIQHPPTTWGCGLIFMWNNPDGTAYNESPTSGALRVTAYTRLTGQEVSEQTVEISGPIS